MANVVLVLLVLTAAVQVYVLTRLPAPGLPGATGKLRQPGSAATVIALAVMLLCVLGFVAAGLLQGGDWRVALILWAGMLLFLYFGAVVAFDGVCYGPEGFALRDGLGRAHAYCWTDVLATERLITPAKGRYPEREIIAVYLPDRTLSLGCTLEGSEQPFLALLKEKRPDLPEGNPDGRRVHSPWPSLVVACLIELFLCAFAVAGLEDAARFGWLWIPAALGAAYVLLLAAAILWPQRFSPRMLEKLLGPETRWKE